MIGRLNGNEEPDITAQLFGQEILSLRAREALDRKRNSGNRRSISVGSGGDSEGSGGATPVISRQNSTLGLRDGEFIKDKSPTSVKDVKGKILASSKMILEKVLSPTKDKVIEKPQVRES